MNSILSKYQRYNYNKKELFENNKEAVFIANLNLLKQMLLLTHVIFFILLLLSYTLPEYYELRSAFWIILIASLCISALMYKGYFKKYALLGLYILFIALFLYGVYASVIISPEQMATSIVGFFCIMPLAVIDQSWRINLMIFFLYLIHTFLVFQFKTSLIAMDDTLTCAVFMICGMYIGENLRVTKLTNFDLHRKAEIQMKVDSLTGLYNRHEMQNKIKTSDQLDSNPSIKGVIMLDVDHFKKFNDLYGHIAGDACLRSLGKTFSKYGKEKDLDFFRYGGEEFLAFSYTHEYEEMLALAEDIRKTVLDLKIPFEYDHRGCVTISLGVATIISLNNRNSESLIKRADTALYRAKETGRNRVQGYDHLRTE